MASLIVGAAVYAIPSLPIFAILVTVSSNDGKPVANLTAANFKVYRVAPGAEERTIENFHDLSQAGPYGEATSEGLYSLTLGAESAAGAKVFAVVVTRRPDRGQTLAAGVVPA